MIEKSEREKERERDRKSVRERRAHMRFEIRRTWKRMKSRWGLSAPLYVTLISTQLVTYASDMRCTSDVKYRP